MSADTVEKATAYEAQAIARVRRIGQARREIHVWRFVSRGTIEEHLTRENTTAALGDLGTQWREVLRNPGATTARLPLL